ncbi:MAG: transporter [Deltaproteobacteria bacterium]|nr:transporter [Deltaproteobacteria bacterium]
MVFMGFVRKFLFIGMLVSPAAAWASHPLITDDAGTQGNGNFQLEVNGEYDRDDDTVSGVSVKSTGGQIATTLTYGVTDTVDIVLSLPYQWSNIKEDGITASDGNGISDTVLEAKWRFFEKDGLGLALKPGISLPTGDDGKGLGTGKTGYHLFFIASQEIAPWAFHLNLGYVGNENNVDEVINIWHASLAATYDVVENLKIVGNIGMEKNTDKAADNDPAFILGGIIYSISKSFDIDFGVKYGLASSETDMSLMAGTTFRF